VETPSDNNFKFIPSIDVTKSFTYTYSNMSGTLVSSLVWVPRGKAALHPKQYTLDEDELERVGKLGGPGVLEQLKKEMAEAEAGSDDEGGEGWEE
jgi:periodic tryptophan protein 1